MATSLAILLSSLYTLNPSESQALVGIAHQILSMRHKNISYQPPVPYSTRPQSPIEEVSSHLVRLSISELAYFLDAARRGHNAQDSERMYGTAQRNLHELDACGADLVRSVINGMLGGWYDDIATSPLPSFSSLQVLPRSKLQHVLLACHFMTDDQLSWFILETGYKLPSIQDPTASSRLLDLPAEMRNWIYREALCEELWVKIGQDSFAQPALLRTCKQIRQETSSIYYRENRFEVAALDMDRQLTTAFVRQAGALIDVDKVRIRWVRSDSASDQLRGYNLLDWVAAYYFGHIKICFKRTGDNASVGPVNGGFELRACSLAFETVDQLFDHAYWHNIVDVLFIGLICQWPFRNIEEFPANAPVAIWQQEFWPKLLTWLKQYFEGSSGFDIFTAQPNHCMIRKHVSGETLRVDCFPVGLDAIDNSSFDFVDRLRGDGLNWEQVEIVLQRLMKNQHLNFGMIQDIAVWSRDQKAWIRTPWIPIDEDGRPVTDAGQRAAFRELWDGDMSAYGWQHVAAGYGERFCIEAEASVNTENGNFGPGGRDFVPRYHFVHRHAHPGRF